ncbi:MAG: hypothetical protein FJ385_00510 [Verrucomicrobia bacterium]|nr:hypothetical protein [Verrucomicrobiota bacterium]
MFSLFSFLLLRTIMRRLVKSAWCVAVVAGIGIIDARAATAASTGLWCDWLRGEPARVHDDPDHPWLQSLRFHGKFQYQLGLVHGTDVDGADFRESYDDYRRLRIGLESTFLQVMNLKTTVNLVDDQRLEGGSLDWGFAGFHEALVGLDLGEVLGRGPFDEWRVDCGRHKFIAGQETRTSSDHLLTVERSAIIKKIYESARPTGVSITASRGRWIWSGAMFSSTQDGADNESLSGWQDGLVWLGSAARRMNDRLNLGVDLAWNNADARREDSFLSYRWATSWHGEYDAGQWGVRGDLIVGDNGGAAMHEDSVRRGAFHGFVLTPYRWIVGRKLQLVGLLAAGLFPGALHAGTITAHPSDAQHATNAAGTSAGAAGGVTNPIVFVGTNSYTGGYNTTMSHHVLPFQLPDLGSGSFSDVSVAFIVDQNSQLIPIDVNLFALPGTRANSVTLASDVNNGTQNHTQLGTLVKQAFLNSSSPGTTVSTGTGESAVLNAWLNDAYANGLNSGRFAFMRLSPTDLTTAAHNALGGPEDKDVGFNVRATRGVGNNDSFGPVLTYTFTPGAATASKPVISSFRTNRTTIGSNSSGATLSWTTSGATSLSINNDVGDVTGTTSRLVTPP